MSSGDEVSISIAGVVTRRYLLASGLRFLDPKERTSVLELCLARAIEWWVANYAPLRFNAGYARRELGYQIKASTARIKRETAAKGYADAILPNVRSGETRRDFLSSIAIETKAVGGAASGQVRGRVKVRVPGYISQAFSLTGNILAKITKAEGDKICDRFAREVVAVSERFIKTTELRNGEHVERTSSGNYDATQLGRTNRATIIAQRQSMAQAARNG